MNKSIEEHIRNNWILKEVTSLFELNFSDLMFNAQTIHRKFHKANQIQLSSLCSVKTGSCPEDCKYCPQSAHYNTNVEKESLNIDEILIAAKSAIESGATRFCMGFAIREIKDRDLDDITNIIKEVKNLGVEICITAGMISKKQGEYLKDSGLDYYNHNIDTSENYYSKIITTRKYEDRINTLHNIRESGLKTCSGGIIGMGESQEDRANMLITLANLESHPESVPINMLVPVAGTPLFNSEKIDNFEFIKTIAIARIMMPRSFVRLSAGRNNMSEEMQSLCFLAGANSIFYGNKLLTTDNPEHNSDQILLNKLGIECI